MHFKDVMTWPQHHQSLINCSSCNIIHEVKEPICKATLTFVMHGSYSASENLGAASTAI